MKSQSKSCPECGRLLSAVEAYQLINLRTFTCPQCQTVLKLDWGYQSASFSHKLLSAMAWMTPAALAMFAVWYWPETLWPAVGLLTLFHLAALVAIIKIGHYKIIR